MVLLPVLRETSLLSWDSERPLSFLQLVKKCLGSFQGFPGIGATINNFPGAKVSFNVASQKKGILTQRSQCVRAGVAAKTGTVVF